MPLLKENLTIKGFAEQMGLPADACYCGRCGYLLTHPIHDTKKVAARQALKTERLLEKGWGENEPQPHPFRWSQFEVEHSVLSRRLIDPLTGNRWIPWVLARRVSHLQPIEGTGS